jgi:hypothetical protein
MNDENRTQPKKAWQKPELIVLLRRKPEEAVLTACKTESLNSPLTDCFFQDCKLLALS